MELQELIQALRRGSVDAHRCLGCGYEHNCSIHGCQLMKQAANQLESLSKQVSGLEVENSVHIMRRKVEKRSSFRLGQMDMRESITLKLRNSASFLSGGLVRAVIIAVADMVATMEVP